jgi:hypothetical protein
LLLSRAANKIAENAKNSTSDISVSVKFPLFIGVLNGVLTEYDENQVKSLVPNCVKVSQCRKSRVFKVYFELKQNLDQFLKVSVKVGYKKLSAQAYISQSVVSRVLNLGIWPHSAPIGPSALAVDHVITPLTVPLRVRKT